MKKQDSKYNKDYSKEIKETLETFKDIPVKETYRLYRVCNLLYDIFYQHYEYCWERKKIKPQVRICQLCKDTVIPKIDKNLLIPSKIENELEYKNELLALRKLFFALSARRNLEQFAWYIESGRGNKVWDKTMDTVRVAFYYMDVFNHSDKLNLLRASFMPSMGKSYMANLYVAQCLGNNPDDQILRITYADDLCITTTGQTKTIIDTKEFREIFPRYMNVKSNKLFKRSTKYELCMCDSEQEYNLFAVTRDGQSTGKRAKKLIIDDLLKDDSESYNKDLHQKMVNRYDSTWTSRAEDDSLKVLMLGTMWAPTDLLNVVYDRAVKDERLIDSKKFKYCEMTESGSAVFIGVPALDDRGNSTCPKRYSTKNLRKRREEMSHFLWQCVYQQKPVAPDGLEFDYSSLKTYTEIDENTLGTIYAVLDPARKGKNFVSMPIFATKTDEKNMYYLVDFLYKKKSMKELYESIVDKIISHRISYFTIENNTDTSLKYIIEEKLHAHGYYNCTIEEKYSVENKEQRIKDNQGAVRGNIYFPCKGKFAPNTDIAIAMESMTSYSFDYPNRYDDAIDSIVLFIQKYVDTTFSRLPVIGTFKR